MVTLAFALAILLLLAVAVPINHDEDQYLAAAMLTRSGRPFVDFLYLQTPLQPYLFAPLHGLFEGWSLLAMRLATAALGGLLLLLAYGASRSAGASDRAARYAMLALACCHAFLFSAGVVRNDMLPAMFAAGGILAGLEALRKEDGRALLWLLAGLCFGAATSTKISYAIPAAAVGTFLLASLWTRTEGRWRGLVAYGFGGLFGLLPTAAAFVSAPAAFLYGVLDYGATAPFEWYAANGLGDRLTLTAKLTDSLIVLARGAGLLALILVAWDAWRTRKSPTMAGTRFLEVLIVAGLVAALLPTPTWRQYFLPLLPPLFARAALIHWSDLRWRQGLAAAAIAFSAVGVSKHVVYLGKAVTTGEGPIVEITRQAHWIGRQVGNGRVATLSPHATIDSGLPLLPEFATGVFAYRTGDAVAPERQAEYRMVSPRTLARTLDCSAPAAIVTGYESGGRLDRFGLDTTLRRYAERRGYRLIRSPIGKAELYIRPRRLPRTCS